MTELDLMIDLHRYSPRQGPGSTEETLKALELIDLPTDQVLQIADLGCGAGDQTITLAQNCRAQITAIDLSSAFLEALDRRVKTLGLSDKIQTLEKSMDDLPFDHESLDIIWSEGAIYNLGFEAGIKKWKPYLKPGGYLSVSEATWISTTRPQEINDFWNREYPEIDKASNKIKLLEDNGYTLTGYFYLAQDSWIENYYKPLATQFIPFLERQQGTEMAKEIVRLHEEEIALYHEYKDYFSYGFYIARKDA